MRRCIRIEYSEKVYRAFNLIDCNWIAYVTQSGRESYDEQAEFMRENLRSLLPSNNILDGSKIRERCFPTIEADVFISHSHADRSQAIGCAEWLRQTFGLRAFVDSCVWEHADVLLRALDTRLCQNPSRGTFYYDLRNRSTSHVHMMLATALTQMMDSTECVFFLNTPNSISSRDAVEKTKSPWLFYELESIRTLRRPVPRRRRLQETTQFGKEAASWEIAYAVPLTELISLNAIQRILWRLQNNGQRGIGSLDTLYALHPSPDQ